MTCGGAKESSVGAMVYKRTRRCSIVPNLNTFRALIWSLYCGGTKCVAEPWFTLAERSRSRAALSAGAMTYRYRPEVLDQLLQHGVRPTEGTRPELVHDFV